ncbi:hypothetical protein D9Q98_008651 [Chlorella vulgaris]|uniref:Cofactor assembly of complex C subunit B n=1 Tax=Chlorella vulgaris TaxID=3077 RepID=A0A9D4TID1_CHLVU|nr:hypothetical protein D9Q98_008651 [Chlorella vulgaris]
MLATTGPRSLHSSASANGPLVSNVSHTRRSRRHASRIVTAAAGPPGQEGLVSRFPDAFRALPLVAGAAGIVGVVANRVISGIAPVVSAGSSQSRTDVLVIVISAVLVLTGLQWATLKPRDPVRVELEGEEADWRAQGLPSKLTSELQWVWDAVRSATRTRSLLLFYNGRCLLHAGVAPAGKPLGAAVPGPICQKAMKSGSGNYLANLVLFPGRFEFEGYLPPNCQAALIQPVGPNGVLVLGSDTQRGYTTLDQAWVSAVADKLEVQLERLAPGSGFKQQA